MAYGFLLVSGFVCRKIGGPLFGETRSMVGQCWWGTLLGPRFMRQKVRIDASSTCSLPSMNGFTASLRARRPALSAPRRDARYHSLARGRSWGRSAPGLRDCDSKMDTVCEFVLSNNLWPIAGRNGRGDVWWPKLLELVASGWSNRP